MTAIDRAARSSSFKGLSGPLRLALLGSTALVGSALLAGQANAQALPDLANAGSATVVFNGAGTEMNVDLGGASRVLDFNSYNIAAGNSANYSTSISSATDLVAVNRVITAGGGPSLIDGGINADAGISVWLINQEGISYNGSATLSGGSLMLSTLDFATPVDAAFRTAFALPGAATGTPYSFVGSGTSPIVIGGNLSVAGSIVAVGQQITTDGALTAANGSVVLVAASDVTFTAGLGNPLSFTVNAGTELGGAVNVNNALTGRSVIVAGGVQDNITAALLNVNAGATLTATAANGTVTLATASVGPNIGIVNGTAAAPSIANNGALVATGLNGDVIVSSAGDLGGTGTITARRDVAISATGDIAVSGSAYTATDGMLSANAGSDAVLGALTAGTDISVTAGASATLVGTVDAGDTLGLVSVGNATIDGNVTTGGAVSLTVLGDTTIAGDIDAGGAYSLTRTRDLDQSGDVNATGNVNVIVSRDARVTGLNASNGGTLLVDVGRDATLGALTATGDLTVSSGGFATINGATNGGNDVLVTSGGDATLSGAMTVRRDVSLSVGGDTFVNAPVTAGRDFLVVDTENYTQVGTVTAARNVDLSVNDDALALAAIEATGGFVDAVVGNNATFAAITAGTDITVSATRAGDFTGDLNAGGDVELTAGPTLFVRAGVSSGDDYQLTAGTITLGAAGTSATQTAARRVFLNALTGNIVGIDGLTLSSAADGAGFGNLELQAAREVRFGLSTVLFAGVPGARTDVVVTSTPRIALGDVTASRLYSAGDTALTASGNIVTRDLAIDNALTITSTGGSVTTRNVAIGALGAALQLSAGGAAGDVSSSGRLTTNAGNIFLSGARDVKLTFGASTALAGVTPVAGALGVQAGRDISAGPLLAGGDVAASAGRNISVSTVRAGDDIDFVSTGGNVSLFDGEATGTGGLTSLRFAGPAGQPGSIVFDVEDPQLALSAIRLRAAAGDVRSDGELTTRNGDLIVNANLDVSLARATATGGALAVRAGRDVLRATTLISTDGDITVGAGRDARLGTLTASDDIDITAVGSLSWTALQLTGGADGTRFTDVTSGTAGATGGVTFSLAPDLALAGANVVRIRAGSVGSSSATTDGLIAKTVKSDSFTATAATGDIHIGSVTSTGDVIVTADEGSVTGLSTTYAAATGGTISGTGGGTVDTVLLDIGTTGSIGAITAGSVRTTGTADTLRIGRIDATTVDLGAVRTLDVGTVNASGTVDLATTGGAATAWGLEIAVPGTLLANDGDPLNAVEDFGSANLASTAQNGRVAVSAENGIAQLGVISAGTGLGGGIGQDQVTVTARALTISQASALDGSLVVTASDGLLSLNRATAKEHVSLVKRDDDAASVNSATDILKVGETTGVGGSITAGFGVDIRSETSLVANKVTAQGNSALDNSVLVTAAGDLLLSSATATTGSIGLYSGGSARGDVGTAVLGTLTAAGDVAIEAAGEVRYARINAGDDVDIVSTGGDLLVRNITSTGAGLTGTSVTFSGAPGAVASVAITAGEEPALLGSTIRLRAEAGDILSSDPAQGLLLTQAAGEILVNAAGSVSLRDITARSGSIGILADSLSARNLTASEDIGVKTLAGTTLVSLGAGDDIDIFAGSIALTNATSKGLAIGSTSVALTGARGTANAISIAPIEDPQLGASTIRLRSLSTVTATGVIDNRKAGEILVNAGTDVNLGWVNARSGSIGVLAGGDVIASNLTASSHIGVMGGVSGGTLGVVSVTATAGEDIDVTAVTGDLFITARATGDGVPDPRTVVFTGAPGTLDAVGVVAGEDAEHVGASIRAFAQDGNVTAASLVAADFGNIGNVFVSASGDAAVTSAWSFRGSIGILAGRNATAGTLTAGSNIFVQGGTGVNVGTAESDDIDMLSLSGDLSLSIGRAYGHDQNTSIVVAAAPGQPGSLRIVNVEDPLLSGGTIRLRAAAGNISSLPVPGASTLNYLHGLRNVLVNASGNVALNVVESDSIGILAGGTVVANTLVAGRDIGIRGGTVGGATLTDVTVTSAKAGDDIDMVALNGDLTLTTGLSTGNSPVGTLVAFTGAPGTPGAVAVASAEPAPFNTKTIHLRSQIGNVTAGTLRARGDGDILVNAAGTVSVALAKTGEGSIGLLAGIDVTAGDLSAKRDVAVSAGRDALITAALAGDDIDVVAGRDIRFADGDSRAFANTGGTSVTFGTAGAANAISVTAGEDPQLTNATIRLRAATGLITGQSALPTGTTLNTTSGDILINAATDVSVLDANARAGSLGVLAGGGVTATNLTAARDVGVQGRNAVTIGAATAGDDIDVTSLAGNIDLTNAAAGPGMTGTSVTFTATPGTTGAVGIAATEDPQLAGGTIRLRAEAGSVTSAGTLMTQGAGDVLVNASGNVSLQTARAAGSLGVLAGGGVTATSLTAARDIGVQGQNAIVIGAATAGDDIDVNSLVGTIDLTNGTTTGKGTAGTSVTFTAAPGTTGAVGIAATEDPQLTGSVIRLRAATGDVTSAGTLQADGDLLANTAGNVSLATAGAGGSIGLLAGDRVTATSLTAARDIGVQAQNAVTIAAATASDDIDVTSLAGAVDLTNGTTTGLGGTGTSVTFTAPPGTIGAVGVAATEDAQLAGSVIRLRAAAGNVTSAGTLQAKGDVLVNGSGNAALSAVTATSGSIGVLAGGQVTATTLNAGRDIGVQAGTGTSIGSATAGDDIDLVALAGNVSLTNGTARGASGGGTSVVYTAAAGTANAVGTGVEDAQLSGSTIRLRAHAGNVTSTGALLAQGTGEVLVNAANAAALAAVNANGGSIGGLAGGQVTATTLIASRDIGLQAGTGITVGSATAGDDIDVVALNGNLALANGTSTGLGASGSSVLFAAAPGTAAAVAIGTEDAQLTGATIRLRSPVGDIISSGALLVQGTGNLLVNASGAITLNAATVTSGSLGALAGGQVTATTLAAGRDIGVQAGAGIAVGSATAGDDIDMVALGGNLALTNGTSLGTAGAGGTSLAYGAAPGAVAAVGVASGENAQLGRASIRLRAANGNVNSIGTLRTQGTGDVLVNARGNLALATTTASAGSVALLAGGSLTAGTTSASEDVAARAGTTAALAATTAGDDVEITAGGLVTTGTATIGGAASGLDARHAVFVVAQAGQAAGIALATGDTRGPKGLPTGSTLANTANGRNIVIEAPDVDIQGVLTSTTGRITLRNTGANPTLVGDGITTTGAGFAVNNAELARLRAGTLVIDSGSKALELGTLTIDTATGTTDTRFLATGGVEITGALTVAGSAERTLQIGGLLGELGDDAGTVPLATSLIARIDRTSRPRIDAGAAHVDLRAEKILFGTTAMVAEYIGMTNDQIAAIVANPASKLYSEAAAQQLGVFLTAKRVTVGYKNFALFQNTDAKLSEGVLINSPIGGLPDQTVLALRLVSTGQDGNNSFAMFGVVNNFSGTPAALLTNEAIEIINPTGNPNDFRVTRASTRLNGCIIGAPDRGCLATDIPQPNFNLYDERKIALFDVDDESTIAISPLIGRGNDGLIVNVADAPVGIDTIECRPEDPNCPAKEGK